MISLSKIYFTLNLISTIQGGVTTSRWNLSIFLFALPIAISRAVVHVWNTLPIHVVLTFYFPHSSPVYCVFLLIYIKEVNCINFNREYLCAFRPLFTFRICLINDQSINQSSAAIINCNTRGTTQPQYWGACLIWPIWMSKCRFLLMSRFVY